MNALSLMIIVSGVLAIFCAFMDYDWFFNHSKAKPFVALFGRSGTRMFYIILGIAVIILGLMS